MGGLGPVSDWLPQLLGGLKFTVLLTVLSMALALALGLVIAAMRLERKPLLYVPATLYVEILRGTPLILQIFFAYFCLPSMGIRLSALTAGTLALGMNTAAYLSEVFRSAIRAVDSSQWEASAALAMPWRLTMRRVILPQALRIALPPTGNYFIALFKDSALASTISVGELLFTGQQIASRSFQYFSVYAVIAVLYLAVSYPSSLAIRWLERRLDLTRRTAPRRGETAPAPDPKVTANL